MAAQAGSADPTVEDTIREFCAQLRRREVQGALYTAKKTVEILRLLITKSRFPEPWSMLEEVAAVGRKIQAAKPMELSIGNAVRRVMHVIREEAESWLDEKRTGSATDPLGRDSAVEPIPMRDPSGHGELVDDQSVASSEAAARRVLPALRGTYNRNVSLASLIDHPPSGLIRRGVSPASTLHRRDVQDSLFDDAGDEAAAQPAPGPRGGAARGRAPHWERRKLVIDGVNELLDEMDQILQQIADQAADYIHAREVVLCVGYSETVDLFLREAARKRTFQVVVAEGAPGCQGLRMAQSLLKAGVQTTVIPDSAIFAMMARVSKVLVGCQALLANGGVISPVGMHTVAQAAKRHAVPFVVLVGLHKLSPTFPHDPDLVFNDFRRPQELLSMDDVAAPSANGHGSTPLQVVNPTFDYVPPPLVSLFVTDTGGQNPFYVYRLLSEYYSKEDYVLEGH
ncbi:unnamed protein product [Pedinophyceae sp. YPF-701]|nr:unnamed protein product [Pedinophyceae sp. YPF-701]